MDYRQSAFQATPNEEVGRTSSVYSEYSDYRPSGLDSTGNGSHGSRTGSRHTSYTPSYMSNVASKSTEPLAIRTAQSRNGTSKHAPTLSQDTIRYEEAPKAPDAIPPPVRGPPGLLFILIANTIHPSTISYLEMLLTRQNLTGIVFAASQAQEAAVKQLKMEVYALLGKLRKEIVVAVHTREEWSQTEVETLVSESTKHGDGIQGVLCCPEFDETGTVDVDVLALEGVQLERSWKQSVAFVHAAVKTTAIQLLSRCKPVNQAGNGVLGGVRHGPFFLVAGSTAYTSASQITKSACDTLILQFERTTKAKGLTVGFAEAMLIPEPSREPPQKPGDESAIGQESYPLEQDDYTFVPSESPTKLWSSWAMHNDLGYVD